MDADVDTEPVAPPCTCSGGVRHGWHVPSCPRHPDYAPDVITLADMLSTGASYRQLDWWTRAGYLTQDPTARIGQGNHRRWVQRDADLVRLMLAFSDAGFATARAAQMARTTLDPDSPNRATFGTMTITWEEHPA